MTESIEKKLNIQYPDIYKKLDKDNILQVNNNGEKVIPSLLYPDDEFWILSEDDILWEIDNFMDNDYFSIKKDYTFIPFAKSGAGDLYCFLFSHIDNNGNIPIVYLWHDDEVSDYLAKNLEDFIFRELLKCITKNGTCDTNFSNKYLDKKNELLMYHKPYISAHQYNILVEKFKQYDMENLLPIDDYFSILRKEVYFENFEESFIYQDNCD